MTSKLIKLPQYTVPFLAGSFGLTEEQARVILAEAGDNRVEAAERARQEKRGTGSSSRAAQ